MLRHLVRVRLAGLARRLGPPPSPPRRHFATSLGRPRPAAVQYRMSAQYGLNPAVPRRP